MECVSKREAERSALALQFWLVRTGLRAEKRCFDLPEAHLEPAHLHTDEAFQSLVISGEP